jgi:hypothetical protein
MKNSEIKQKLEDAINEMHKLTMDTKQTPNTRAYSANALSGLVSRYKDMFGIENEEPTRLKSVKNF